MAKGISKQPEKIQLKPYEYSEGVIYGFLKDGKCDKCGKPFSALMVNWVCNNKLVVPEWLHNCAAADERIEDYMYRTDPEYKLSRDILKGLANRKPEAILEDWEIENYLREKNIWIDKWTMKNFLLGYKQAQMREPIRELNERSKSHEYGQAYRHGYKVGKEKMNGGATKDTVR
jgi:hypothetical protein